MGMMRMENTEYRSQKSGVRNFNRGDVAREKFADLFKLPHMLFCVSVAEIACQDQVVATFFQRALRDVHEARLVTTSFLLETLRDICRYRNCGTPELRSQAINLFSRKVFAQTVHTQNKL